MSHAYSTGLSYPIPTDYELPMESRLIVFLNQANSIHWDNCIHFAQKHNNYVAIAHVIY
jgi:hypothetical protein